ncbi:MAG TPA: stage III sporulation protein AC [Clostridiales bacterium]|jgi:stage III sporulation protein AC|nr:stage III sporulation protein AC [Clostridia bacterium]MBS6583895.1 stage III sporulation protein AC [Subdoligranulum sp.]PWM87202.1 MAG: stage III sporulation protein AC [Subdoligranulum sp.]CDE71529.1 stage III sporulation protein AC [Subdoligranulum sp. CAG:314]HCW81616.1 stage III sporulation protein AC [Clostridiales bacterium]
MEVEIIFKIAAIGILTALISVLLKKSDKDEIATLVTIAGLILVLLIVIDMIVQLFDVIQGLFDLKALYEYY